jgi:hypothetical protein
MFVSLICSLFLVVKKSRYLYIHVISVHHLCLLHWVKSVHFRPKYHKYIHDSLWYIQVLVSILKHCGKTTRSYVIKHVIK